MFTSALYKDLIFCCSSDLFTCLKNKRFREEEEMLQLNAKLVLLNLLLLLVLFNRRFLKSNEYSQQEARGNSAALDDKVKLEDFHFETANKKFGFGGRKMGSFDNFMKGHGPCERPPKIRGENRRNQSIRSLFSKEKDMARFVAFNADYKGPRHHPPKNN